MFSINVSCFCGSRKAFDKMDRTTLWGVMQRCNPVHLIGVIKSLYDDRKIWIKLATYQS